MGENIKKKWKYSAALPRRSHKKMGSLICCGFAIVILTSPRWFYLSNNLRLTESVLGDVKKCHNGVKSSEGVKSPKSCS